MAELKRIWRSAHRAWPPLTPLCFVCAEQGKVLKVLHTSEGVFPISQYSLFHNEGPVLNMAIDSQKVSDPDPVQIKHFFFFFFSHSAHSCFEDILAPKRPKRYFTFSTVVTGSGLMPVITLQLLNP